MGPGSIFQVLAQLGCLSAIAWVSALRSLGFSVPAANANASLPGYFDALCVGKAASTAPMIVASMALEQTKALC